MPYRNSEAERAYHKAYRATHKAESRAYRKTYRAKPRSREGSPKSGGVITTFREIFPLSDARELSRLADSFYASRSDARRKGYAPLNLTTVKSPVRAAFCDLCNKPPKRNLCLDHDHTTGRFRGWLCYRCNVSIGQLGDSILGLQRAISYLESRLSSDNRSSTTRD